MTIVCARIAGVATAALLGFLALSASACGGSTHRESEGSSVTSCASFSACGGDVVGTWDLVALCSALVTSRLPAECRDKVSITESTGSGEIEFTGIDVRTAFESHVTATYRYDQTCAAALFGSVTVDEAFCGALEDQYVAMPVSDSVSCAFGMGTCVCAFGYLTKSGSTQPYVTQGTNLVPMDGAPVPYCVNGDELRLQDVGDVAVSTYVYERRR